MPFLTRLGADDKVGDALGRFNTGTSRPLIEYHEALLRGDSPLTVAERELIAAFVSATNACAYCEGAHTAAAAQFGVDPELVRQLIGDLAVAPVAERMRPVLAFASKLTQTPSRMTQADADAVLAAGWDERALYDIVQVTALFNFMNRLRRGPRAAADPRALRGHRRAPRAWRRPHDRRIRPALTAAGHPVRAPRRRGVLVVPPPLTRARSRTLRRTPWLE